MARQRIETDVVFVGGGSAGLSGAVRAAELGLRAVVLEKLGSCGGDALMAAGFWVAAETPYQKAQGIEDSQEAFYRYLVDYSAHRCQPELIRVLVERAAANLAWLEAQGLSFSPQVQAHGVTTVPRVHQNEGMGARYVNVMKGRAEELGVDLRLQTGAKELLVEGGAVVGVVAEGPGGEEWELRARGVVLTTGGFGKSPELVARHSPYRKRHAMVCAGWARGDGIRLAEQAGAEIADTQVAIGYKAEMPGTSALTMRSFYLILATDYVVVNRQGRRFVDESVWNAHFAHALNTQTDATGFVILDEAMRTGNPFHDFSKEIGSGKVRRGDSFAELAGAAGLPVEAFSETLERYNRFARAGRDEAFGKAAASLKPLESPPYYAVEIVPLVLNTVGGPRIDAGARALRPDGTPIAGLYAAGNNAAGFYDNYPTTGAGLQISSIFGQVAAEQVKASS
ncbi:MAG: flavocytochrome c [Deferrisomatales bacterium]